MSLYNMLHGKNPQAKEILELLHISELDIERFRDCGINKEEHFIWILARTGGPNRKSHINRKLVENSYYIKDMDESFDQTYAVYFFTLPTVELSQFDSRSVPDLKEMTNKALENIQNGNANEETEQMISDLKEKFTKMFGK